jgi:hypothetical protein
MRFRESMVLLATLILVAFPMAADISVTLVSKSCTTIIPNVSARLNCKWKGGGCTITKSAEQSGYCVTTDPQAEGRCTEFTDFEGCMNRWCHRINAHANDTCTQMVNSLSFVRLCPKDEGIAPIDPGETGAD